MTRKYTLRRRAEQQDETRTKILEATVELHEELGPRNATISAIAERAGVQRLTVYRHFPDEVALFAACTAHWLTTNPPPDPGLWRDVPAAGQRTRAALLALYGYYRRTERMWDASYRDVGAVPALQPPMAAFERYLDVVRADLQARWPDGGQAPAARATLAHCLRFTTWQSMSRSALTDPEIADAAVDWITAVARHARSATPVARRRR
jgi:AcrR family transcriptional regulator